MQPEDAAGETNYRRLRERMGERLFRKRIDRQAGIWATEAHQGQGVFFLERYLPLDELIATGLRWMCLDRMGEAQLLDLRVETQVLRFSRLPAAFDGMRLLHLSDLHCDIHPGVMEGVLSAVRMLEFDFAVLTGDYHNRIGSDMRKSLASMERLLQELRGRCVGVLGNHDFIEKVAFLEHHGMPVLLNESWVLERDGDRLVFCGVDDAHYFQTHDLQRAAENATVDDFRILLSHSPEIYAEVEAAGFDLMFSGHMHGGQLCLPGGAVVIKNAQVPDELVQGLWAYGDLVGYTSRGAGACGVAARLNCPPEITVFTLQK